MTVSTDDRLEDCCFPDCGCDGARNCDAKNGASTGALALNVERGTRVYRYGYAAAERAMGPWWERER